MLEDLPWRGFEFHRSRDGRWGGFHRRNTALLLCSFSTVNLANIGSVCVSMPLGSDRAAGGSLCTRSMSSEINTMMINMYMRRAKVLRECARLCVLVSAKADQACVCLGEGRHREFGTA